MKKDDPTSVAAVKARLQSYMRKRHITTRKALAEEAGVPGHYMDVIFREEELTSHELTAYLIEIASGLDLDYEWLTSGGELVEEAQEEPVEPEPETETKAEKPKNSKGVKKMGRKKKRANRVTTIKHIRLYYGSTKRAPMGFIPAFNELVEKGAIDEELTVHNVYATYQDAGIPTRPRGTGKSPEFDADARDVAVEAAEKYFGENGSEELGIKETYIPEED